MNVIQENYYAQASEDERQQLREWVKGLLQSDKVTVTFTKSDGTARTMVCTTSEVHGAKYVVTEGSKARKPNPEVCVVWDCSINEWRSFRWDRLKQVEFNIG